MKKMRKGGKRKPRPTAGNVVVKAGRGGIRM